MSNLQKFWRGNSALIHLSVWIFIAGMTWAGVAAQATRIDKLEERQEAIGVIQQDIGVIKESLDWIKREIRK